MNFSLRRTGSACAAATALSVLLLASGCHKHRKTTSAPNTTDYSDNIEALVGQSQLNFLRWPNVSDYQSYIKTFYDDRNDEIAWTRDGRPTPAAVGFMKEFAEADYKGLVPEDYDSSRWAARVKGLTPTNEDAVAQFDVAMTVCVMRYISDLRIGRVNPSHFNFDINVALKKYDLAEFVSDNAVDVTDVPKLIATVEPNSEPYRETEQALGRYVVLAQQQVKDGDPPIPAVSSTVSEGAEYADAQALLERLQIEGDINASDVPDTPQPKIFNKLLSDGVKSFQHRHGLTEDGKLSQQTVDELNVPLSDRVVQLGDSLERWRWLPDQYVNPRLMVNLPEFVLRGYAPDHQLDFTMRVVVGKVVGEHQTPVFAHMMRYLVFRPYWNVPVDIARKELVPHMASNPHYLDSHNFEVVNSKGQVQTNYTAKQVAEGGLMVREKPGPKNSLGLVKFMFPNQYDIYLHSTPATELFNRTRRDFSHGCVRVQKPEDLAAWLLDDQGWDLDRVHETMTDGPDNHQVNLKAPVPIVIFYMTAEVEPDGHVHFFDDIYGYDKELNEVLKKGPPYPMKPEPEVKTKPGDTA
jgi:murein L,D-transpeptidase YcbB/YkuD